MEAKCIYLLNEDDIPFAAKHLKVEIDEWFCIAGANDIAFRINLDGTYATQTCNIRRGKPSDFVIFMSAIEDPAKVIRLPRLTHEEVRMMDYIKDCYSGESIIIKRTADDLTLTLADQGNARFSLPPLLLPSIGVDTAIDLNGLNLRLLMELKYPRKDIEYERPIEIDDRILFDR